MLAATAKDGVLIPFKAGHWFKHGVNLTLCNKNKVLIPFKAGHWFKQARGCSSGFFIYVLIPFKAGHWFKPPSPLMCIWATGCLNPF